MTDFVRGLLTSVAPVWEEADPAGGGGGGDSSKGGVASPDPGGSWTAPEGLPKEFLGGSADEVLGKMLPAYRELDTRAAGLREKLANHPAPPKSADEYSFEPSDAVKAYVGDVAANPVMRFAREAAHKHGLSNDQFGAFINDVYGAAAEAGVLLPALDAKAELASYAKHGNLGQAEVERDWSANKSFAEGLAGQLKGIPDDKEIRAEVQGLLGIMQDTAGGNFLLSALRQHMVSTGFKVPGQGEGGQSGQFFAKEELQAMAADPRMEPANRDHPDPARRYDPALRKKLEDSYHHHYPEERG